MKIKKTLRNSNLLKTLIILILILVLTLSAFFVYKYYEKHYNFDESSNIIKNKKMVTNRLEALTVGYKKYYYLMQNRNIYDNESGIQNKYIRVNGERITNANQLNVGDYNLEYYAVDYAGNTTVKIRPLKISNALKDIKEEYSNYEYIKYGTQLFVIYKTIKKPNYDCAMSCSGKACSEYCTQNGSFTIDYKAILDGVYQQTSFSSTECCDTGVCNYENNNFTNNQIGGVLNQFLRTLPSNYEKVLNYSSWSTGYVKLNNDFEVAEDFLNNRYAYSYVGLMSFDEKNEIGNPIKITESVLGKYWWLSNMAYRQSGQINAMAAIAYDKEVSGSKYWKVYAPSNLNYIYGTKSGSAPAYARPVVVFDGNVVIQSGSGTKADPYIVN